MLFRIPLLTVVWLFLTSGAADACSCVPSGPPCAAYWEVAAVFVGRVESIDSGTDGRIGGSRVVRFSILEAFRGVTGGAAVEVRTGRGGGDCGYRFRDGKEYFVYAYRHEESGELGTGICTRTRPVEDAEADLAYARTIGGPDPPAGRISGQLMLRGRAGGGPAASPEPLAGIPVVLEGESDTRRTVTDRYGTFEFAGAAAGTYNVRLELPDRYYTGPLRPLRLPDERACLDLPITVHYDGRAHGRVLDARGAPVVGLTLELTSDPRRGGASDAPALRTLTRSDGSYEFSRVPPGRFVIAVPIGAGDSAVDSRRVHPARLTMTPGGRVAVADFVLPASVPFARLAGIVVDADGYFADGVRVYLAGPDDGDAIIGGPAITDASGRFELAAPAGRAYGLLAERPAGENPGSRVDSSGRVRVYAASDLAPIRLALRPRY